MSVSIEHLRPGDVVVVRVRRFSYRDSGVSDRASAFEERAGRVLQVYRRFCVVLLPRGDELVRESFFFEDIIAVNPAGIDAPVLRLEDVTHVATEPQREEATELARGRLISSEDAMEALRLQREEGLNTAQIAEKLGVTYNRAKAMLSKAHRLERARVQAGESEKPVEADEATVAAEEEPKGPEPLTEEAESAATAEALPFDLGAASEEMDLGLVQAAAARAPGADAAPPAEADGKTDPAAERMLRAASQIVLQFGHTLDRTRAQVATLEQEVALLRDELRTLRRKVVRHIHLPDGRAVVAEEIEEVTVGE